jgi:hypothetical protein
MISPAERKALKTVEDMVNREKELHKQIDMLSDFANSVHKAVGAREDGWKCSYPPEGHLQEVARLVLGLRSFKETYENIQRDRCSTCKSYRMDIDGDVSTVHFCKRLDRFFPSDFYCKDWNKR